MTNSTWDEEALDGRAKPGVNQSQMYKSDYKLPAAKYRPSIKFRRLEVLHVIDAMSESEF